MDLFCTNKMAPGVSEGAEHESGFKNFPSLIETHENNVFGHF